MIIFFKIYILGTISDDIEYDTVRYDKTVYYLVIIMNH